MTDSSSTLAARHRVFGWWSLVVFVLLGFVLETLHGFKVGWYLDLANETRRHLFTLAHAHGTLLGLVHLAFATTESAGLPAPPQRVRLASALFVAASLLLPGGFFLGGLDPRGGDPGFGVLAAPFGAAALFGAVFLTALDASTSARRSR